MSQGATRAKFQKFMDWLLGWPAEWFGPILTAAGAALIPLSVTDDDGLAEGMRWVTDVFWLGVGVVALIGGIAWTIGGAKARKDELSRLQERLTEAKAKTTERVIHKLSPLIHDLGQLAHSQGVNHGRDLVNRALHLATEIIDVPDIRACLYYLDHVESDEASSLDIPNSLTLRSPHIGRFDTPRPSFVRESGRVADEVFEVIDTGVPRLVEDVNDTDYTVDCVNKKYNTFLNVPVKFQTQEIGVLSVDAPNAKSLTANHLLLAQLVAQFIAVGLRREQKNLQDRNPRPRDPSAETPIAPGSASVGDGSYDAT